MSDTATSGAAAPVDAAPSQTATTSNAGSWRETLPADLRDNPSLRSINDIPSLAKSYVHAQSLVGADKVVIPKDNASQEEWSNFFSKVGRPGNANDYKLGRPENFPEQYFDADMNNHMMQVFHESGLSSKQAKLLHSKYMEYVNTRINQNTQQAQQQSEQAIAALKQQYGPDFNVRVAAAQRAIQRFGSQELISYLDKSGLGNNPELIKLFSNVGMSLTESRADGSGDSSFGGVSPTQAQAELDQLRADKDFIKQLTDKSVLGHKEAAKKWQQLHAIAFPAEQ
jgi:hypothetical protein